MRGGRNKFGSYYKLDRAQRVKQFQSTDVAPGSAQAPPTSKGRRQATASSAAAAAIVTDASVSSR